MIYETPSKMKFRTLPTLMRLQTILLLLIISLLSCNTEYRKTIDTYSNGKVKTEYVYSDKSDKSKYTIFDYYDNGQILFKGTVDSSKFVGVKLNYYENGNLEEVDSILNPCDLDFCCCDGKVFKYYSNGKLNQTFENKNGAVDGLAVLYSRDSSGKVWSVRNYNNDKQSGITKIFYPSGKLYKIETYRDDTLVDHVFYFEKNGDTMKIIYTWKGREDFPTKTWLADGQIFYATYLDSSYKNALYRWTDKAGKELKRQIVSINKSGEWITSNGKWLTPN